MPAIIYFPCYFILMTEFLEIKGTGSIKVSDNLDTGVYSILLTKYSKQLLYIILYKATVGINHNSKLM